MIQINKIRWMSAQSRVAQPHRWTRLHAMRLASAIAASLLIVCGCSASEQPRLESLAQSLTKAWPRANWNLELTMRATETNGKVVLHCVLKNTSVTATALTLNRSHLPWTAPADLSVVVLAADGKMPARPPPPVVVSILEAGPSDIIMNPGETLDGDVDLESGPIVPVGKLPRNKDLLLIWSYSLDIRTPGENSFFSGVTFLERR
jgi:hypothetical protein